MQVTVLENGSLQIRAEKEDADDIESVMELSDDDALAELLESYWTNGSYYPFDAGQGEPFVGLTCAPCIAEHMDYSDTGKRSIDGRLWWYPDYMISSPIQKLKNEGVVIFEYGFSA